MLAIGNMGQPIPLDAQNKIPKFAGPSLVNEQSLAQLRFSRLGTRSFTLCQNHQRCNGL